MSVVKGANLRQFIPMRLGSAPELWTEEVSLCTVKVKMIRLSVLCPVAWELMCG